MGDDPVGALIGSLLMGFGTLILYGAFKNRKIFGKDGLLATALTTGSIIDVSKIPQAYESFKVSLPETPTNSDLIKGVIDAVTPDDTKAGWQMPPAVRDAIINIGKTDEKLGQDIARDVSSLDSKSKRINMLALQQRLIVASARGHDSDVSVIKNYIRELTGESL